MFQSIAASFQGGGIVTPAAAGVNKFSRSQMRDRRARLTMIVSESLSPLFGIMLYLPARSPAS
jgi:hypothetical protein